MSDIETKMIIKFLGKEKKLTLIDDYNKFLEKCYKLFTIKENEKKNLKIYVVDEDDDNLAIENEDDFKEQRIINEENNTITYVLELEGKIESNEKSSEYQTQDYVDDNNKKNDNTFEDNNKKNDNTFEDNNNMNNEDNNENNNECINNNDYSKIIDLLKEENKKFRDELYEKINNLSQLNKNNNDINKNTEVEKELKKTIKKSINDVKTFLMTIDEGIKKNNEENKETNTNMEKELKKNMKKSINDVKTFLIAMDEGMKKNNEQLLNTIYETKVQTQNNNNDKKLEEIKNEIINKIISLEETTNNFKKEFKNLENKFERMKEDIRKQNIIQSKKQEKEEFYGCLFEDGNYILQYYYDDLINLNPYIINIKLLNNGNLSWPSNSFLNIYSNDNFFQKNEIINKDFEVQPKQNINYNLKIPQHNKKNEKYEIKINFHL